MANKADLAYIEKLRQQKEKSDERAEKFKKALDIAGFALSKCTVSPELVRLLNERRESEPVAGPPAKPQPATPETQAGSNCALVLETYNWNIDNVIEPNRLQIEGLQKFYRDVQQKFNRQDARSGGAD